MVYYAHKSRREPADAVLFVTWRDVLAVIEAGCADGYRERYEQAYAQYVADNRAADEEWKAGRPAARRRPVSDAGIYDATTALIRHGLDVQAARRSFPPLLSWPPSAQPLRRAAGSPRQGRCSQACRRRW